MLFKKSMNPAFQEIDESRFLRRRGERIEKLIFQYYLLKHECYEKMLNFAKFLTICFLFILMKFKLIKLWLSKCGAETITMSHT